MADQRNLPTVVIVGRPNVGKSTLFNAILGQRRSIVGDEPGITRDRIQGEAVWCGRRFELIDTGGIIPNDAEMIPTEILKQARVALDQAAHSIFLIDGRGEITGIDRDLARILRRPEEPAARKIKVAIIGRPNVGKSTLLNALVGSERSIVSEVAGTTRDAVDET